MDGSKAPGDSSGPLALVLTGGGARSAYQAGFLRALTRRHPELEVPIITGVSAGAINAIFLAARSDGLARAAERLADFWSELSTDRVFRTDLPFLLRNVLRWGLRLVSGGAAVAPEVRGLLDTEPLARLLASALGAAADGSIPGIDRNLESGRLKAVSLMTLDYATDRSVAWVQGRDIRDWERPARSGSRTSLGVRHVMASSALPLLFPAVRLGDSWHGDGGIRHSAPLSPAIHLGARRLLTVSTRQPRGAGDVPTSMRRYPSPAQILGSLVNAVFFDAIDEDAQRAERLNRLLRHLPESRHPELDPVELMVVRPSADLARLAGRYESRLPRAFRFLTRGLGTREARPPDFLSLLLFEPDYLGELVAIGEADGERRMGELERFLGLDPRPGSSAADRMT